MIRLLILLLRWRGIDVHELRKRSVPVKIREVAKILTPWILLFSDVSQSSDWKRKEVYALGIKRFPLLPKNTIAYALEYAIWRMR